MTLTPNGYHPRYVDEQIPLMLEAFGAVCVEGPKYCGKTWASLNHAESVFMVSDQKGDFENRRQAELDASYALKGTPPHLIDEWQVVSKIWDAVRMDVDSMPMNGRFILTGSSTPVTKGVYHSGAGRIGRMRMRTMSLYESGDSDGHVGLMDLFDDTLQQTDAKAVELDHLIDIIIRGGWPRNIGLSTRAAIINNRGYLETCIEDAANLDGKVRNREKIEMTLRSLARNESTMASESKIKNDVTNGSISDKAVGHYIDVFDRLFLINNQLPFDPGYRSSVRVGKSVKRHLTDPALTSAIMNLSQSKLRNDLKTFGFLFEAMCERDLDIYARSVDGTLYHYRDPEREIDAVVELDDGRWGAFEIKLGTNQIDAAAKNLMDIDDYMSDRTDNAPDFLCVICGMSSTAYRRSDGVYVVPITSLRGAKIPDIPQEV